MRTWCVTMRAWSTDGASRGAGKAPSSTDAPARSSGGAARGSGGESETPRTSPLAPSPAASTLPRPCLPCETRTCSACGTGIFHDVLVVGGGINGAVSAACLAGRGARVRAHRQERLRVRSPARSRQTSRGAASKYMEDIRVRARACALHVAQPPHSQYPSTVQEIRFYAVHERGFRHGLWKLVLGTWLYWLLGNFFTRPPQAPRPPGDRARRADHRARPAAPAGSNTRTPTSTTTTRASSGTSFAARSTTAASRPTTSSRSAPSGGRRRVG